MNITKEIKEITWEVFVPREPLKCMVCDYNDATKSVKLTGPAGAIPLTLCPECAALEAKTLWLMINGSKNVWPKEVNNGK